MSETPVPKIELYFYTQANSGSEPVRNWLKDQSDGDRRAIGLDLQRVQYRWPVGMPLCRPLGKGLWEVRSSLASGTISRVLICFHGGEIYALHGFIKKTQATPDEDLKLARKRMKDIEDG